MSSGAKWKGLVANTAILTSIPRSYGLEYGDYQDDKGESGYFKAKFRPKSQKV